MEASTYLPKSGMPIGQEVRFPSQLPVRYVAGGKVFLRSGHLETDITKFNAALWGESWLSTDSTGFSMSGICYSPVDNVLIATNNGSIHRSTDKGVTFTDVTSGGWSVGIAGAWGSAYLNGVYCLIVNGGNSDAGFWNSHDLGITWTKRTTGVLSSGVDNFGAQILIGGNGNTSSALNYIYRSTDGGDTWTTVNLPESSYKWGRNGVVAKPTDRNIGIIMGEDKMARTADAGLTWTIVATYTWTAHSGWGFATNGLGLWLLHKINELWESVDDGLTWNKKADLAVSLEGPIVYDPVRDIWWCNNMKSEDDGNTWFKYADTNDRTTTSIKHTIPYTGFACNSSYIFENTPSAGIIKELRDSTYSPTIAYAYIGDE